MATRCAMYINNVEPLKDQRGMKKPRVQDKTARHKEVAAQYYRRRGAFVAFRRRIELKLGLDKGTLKHIENIEQLEDFSRRFLSSNTGNEFSNGNAIAYLAYIYAV